MKVLVTGADSQVGWELQNQAVLYDVDLYALDRKSLDITNTEAINEQVMKYNPDIIVNTAAFTSVDRAEKEDSLAYEVNCIGVRKLADICKKMSIILIHISTDYVFNGLQEEPYNEEDLIDPINVYGRTKWDGEEAIRSILDNHIILRTSWVFGIQGNNFVKTIIDLAKQKKELNIIEDQYGCPTSARAIALAILNICDKYRAKKKLQYGTYHYSGTPDTSWYIFAKKIIKIATAENLIGSKSKIKPISSTDFVSACKRPNNSTLSSEKIQKVFGIIPSPWIADLEYTIISLMNI